MRVRQTGRVALDDYGGETAFRSVTSQGEVPQLANLGPNRSKFSPQYSKPDQPRTDSERLRTVAENRELIGMIMTLAADTGSDSATVCGIQEPNH